MRCSYLSPVTEEGANCCRRSLFIGLEGSWIQTNDERGRERTSQERQGLDDGLDGCEDEKRLLENWDSTMERKQAPA
jgi:hypothetical protein